MSIKSHNYARKMTHQVNMTPAKSTTWIRCLKPIWYKNRPSFCKLSSVPHMNTVTHIYYTKTTTQPPTHNAPIIFKKIKAYKCIYLYCDKNCNKIRKKRARFYNPKINVYFFYCFWSPGDIVNLPFNTAFPSNRHCLVFNYAFSIFQYLFISLCSLTYFLNLNLLYHTI